MREGRGEFIDHWKAAERRVDGWDLRYQPWKSKPVLLLAGIKLLVAGWTWARGVEVANDAE